MFISLLNEYYEKSNDVQYIKDHTVQINMIMNVIFSTLDDGLTFATPSYKVKYLMDNSEVYKGLSDAYNLYSTVLSSEAGYSQKILSARSAMKNKIETKMWTSKGYGHYWSGIDYPNSPEKFRWNRFYADATSQLFPVINGVVSAKNKRSKHVYKLFNKYWSNGEKHHRWERLDTTDSNCWGDIVYVAVLMKDYKRADTYMKVYYKKYAQRHQYPLYNADSAKVLRAAILMKNVMH